jgi:hypothetical protein
MFTTETNRQSLGIVEASSVQEFATLWRALRAAGK